MAISGNQSEEKISKGEKRKQEGIRERSNEKEFEAGLPFDQTRRLESHLGFGKTQGHFYLPTPGIGKDDFPGLFSSVYRLSGNQVPRFATIAGARDNQE
jgi:hypothetical protein